MQNILHISFTKEELLMLTNFLDADKSGDIDMREFCSKITLNNLHKDSHKYLLSEHQFIETVLNAWYEHRGSQIKEIIKKIGEFDENGDGLMQFDEFSQLISKLEPNVSQQKVLELFKEAIAISQNDQVEDAIDPKHLAVLILKYKIGGYGREFFAQYLLSKKKKYLEQKLAKKGKY